jgi:hypothetical protein
MRHVNEYSERQTITAQQACAEKKSDEVSDASADHVITGRVHTTYLKLNAPTQFEIQGQS